MHAAEVHERDHTVAISRRSLPRPPKSKATKTRQSSGRAAREGARERVRSRSLGEKQATRHANPEAEITGWTDDGQCGGDYGAEILPLARSGDKLINAMFSFFGGE